MYPPPGPMGHMGPSGGPPHPGMFGPNGVPMPPLGHPMHPGHGHGHGPMMPGAMGQGPYGPPGPMQRGPYGPMGPGFMHEGGGFPMRPMGSGPPGPLGNAPLNGPPQRPGMPFGPGGQPGPRPGVMLPPPQPGGGGAFSRAMPGMMIGGWMKPDDVEYVVRSLLYTVANGVPYVEDYYYQAFLHKHVPQPTRQQLSPGAFPMAAPFVPEALRELSDDAMAHIARLDPSARAKFVEGITGLGKIVLTNIRTPKVLMDLSATSNTGGKAKEADGGEAGAKAPARPLEQEPLLAARIMIEDVMNLLLDAPKPAEERDQKEAADAAAADAANGKEGAEGAAAADDAAAASSASALGPNGPSPYVLLWAVLRNAWQLFGPSLQGLDPAAERPMLEATSRLAAALRDALLRLPTPRDVVDAAVAFNAGAAHHVEALGRSNPGAGPMETTMLPLAQTRAVELHERVARHLGTLGGIHAMATSSNNAEALAVVRALCCRLLVNAMLPHASMEQARKLKEALQAFSG
eukprot:XP_001698077.1 predicted protein [Chlamydomonas reinhardtii]